VWRELQSKIIRKDLNLNLPQSYLALGSFKNIRLLFNSSGDSLI
jgi:hypothetical protein